MIPKENSDLLTSNQRNLRNAKQNGNVSHQEPALGPPDGGIRAYMVIVGSFLTNGLIFGVINSYSVIYMVLLRRLNAENVANAEMRASLVGALTMGTTFVMSPLSGFLTGLMGLRMTTVVGGSIAATGLLLSSFVVDHVDALCFTYGILYGLGASLAYTPSLAILGHYFKKYLGIVNGIVTIGSSVFTVFMPPLMQTMIERYGLEWMFRLVALFTVGISLCGLLFKPIPLMVIEKSEDKSFKFLLKTLFNVGLWKNKMYRLWALSMPIALFGYFVPYVHIKELIKWLNFRDVNDNLPLQCIAITSGLGRFLFGFLSDRPGVNRIILQQVSFYVIGILTIALPFVKSFGLLVAISLGMGLCEGGFIALIGPIAIQLCGGAYAAQAIGCMLGLAATPLSVGPPIAGFLFSHYGSYKLAFILAGCSPIVGATLMFTMRFQRNRNRSIETDSNGHVTLARVEIDKDPVPLLNGNGEANYQAEPNKR